MNQTKSNQKINEWMTKSNPLRRTKVEEKRKINADRMTIFPLLCPTREFDWIPTWDCELLHSESGMAERNCIFKTGAGFEEETWVCTHYHPDELIHYSRFSQNYFTKLEISLEQTDVDGTEITWSIELSALNEKGNAIAMLDDEIRIRIKTVLEFLESYLTGD